MNKRQAPTSTERAPLLLTVQQAAELLGVGKDLVYGLINQGSLPTLNLARPGQRQKLRIPLAVLEQWIMEQTRQQNPDNDLITSRQSDVDTSKPTKRARKTRVPSGRVIALPTSTQGHS
jgi:excisionase family DNA binding protein